MNLFVYLGKMYKNWTGDLKLNSFTGLKTFIDNKFQIDLY